MGAQYQCDHIFCGGLAHTSGYPHKEGLKLPAIVCGKCEQCLTRTVHHNTGTIRDHMIRDYRHCPLFACLSGKGMPIKPGTPQCKKYTTRCDRPGIG